MQKCIKKGLNEVNQSVGMDIQKSFNNLQKCMEKGLHEVNQSIKELGRHNLDRLLLLAEKYNTSGNFPLVLLLDKNGVVLGIEGYKNYTAADYIQLIHSFEK